MLLRLFEVIDEEGLPPALIPKLRRLFYLTQSYKKVQMEAATMEQFLNQISFSE